MYVFVSNIINEMNFSDLNTYEYNLLFGIFGRLNKSTEISLRADEVKDMCSNKSNFTYKEAEETAISLCKKIDRIRSLFDVFQVDYADSENKEFDGMWIKIWEKNIHLFRYMDIAFTVFVFEELKEIRTVSSKTIYRLLAQFKHKGLLNINYDELCGVLGCENREFFEINQKILQPSIDRLNKYFKNLSIEFNRGKKNGKFGCISVVFKFDKYKLPIIDDNQEEYDLPYSKYAI